MVKVEKLDHYGRGITYIDDKITFLNNALPNEEVKYKITKSNNKFQEGKVTKIITKSKKRVEPPCPFYDICGGCSLQHLTYEKTLEFKKQKVQEILSRYAHINEKINIIKNPSPYQYRNKLSLKIKDGKIGFYEAKTHKIVEITKCLLAKEEINNFLKDLKYFELNNAEVTIRSNYNQELLIAIKTKDQITNCYKQLAKLHKIVGIIVNDKLAYGEDKFIDIVDHKLFQVSYNSFFQVNSLINQEIFQIIKKEIKKEKVVADLYCGVGTLAIVASDKAKQVYGIEIIPNAIKNALVNQKMNKVNNVNFCLGDAKDIIKKIKTKIDTIIIDPPRSGLSVEALNNILKIKPTDLIYISCDPMTLARDLNTLKQFYKITKLYIADMFSYTYHVESICILKLLN